LVVPGRAATVKSVLFSVASMLDGCNVVVNSPVEVLMTEIVPLPELGI